MYFCSFLTFVDYLNYPAKSLKNIKETFVLSHSIDPAQSGIKKVRNFTFRHRIGRLLFAFRILLTYNSNLFSR